jgi:hypothetical protein
MGKYMAWTITVTVAYLLVAAPLIEAPKRESGPHPSGYPTMGTKRAPPARPDWIPEIPVRGTDTSTVTGHPDAEPWACLSQEPEYGGVSEAVYPGHVLSPGYVPVIATGTQIGNAWS